MTLARPAYFALFSEGTRVCSNDRKVCVDSNWVRAVSVKTFPLSGLNSACFTLRSKLSFPTFILIYLEQECHMQSLILTSLSSTPHRNVYCSLSKCSGFVYLLQCVLGKKHGPHGPSWHF